MAIPTALLEIGRPAAADLVIRQGDSWRTVITVTINGVAANLTGLTAALKVKATIGGTLLATATCTIPIGTDGQIIATMTPAVTAALTATGDAREVPIGYWDCDITDGTDRITVAGGGMALWREVTL